MDGGRWAGREGPEDDALARWLGASLSKLPRLDPPAGFTNRLLMATRPAWPEAAVSTRDELVITAGVIAGAFALTVLPVAVAVLLVVLNAGLAATWLARGTVLLAQWMDAGTSAWGLAVRTSDVVQTVAGSAAGSRLLVMAVLTALVALAGLSRLWPDEGRVRSDG